MRKAEVFWWAAVHAAGDERQAFLAKAAEFFDYSVNTLGAMPTRHFTRPLVLMLTNGYRRAWFAATPLPAAPDIASGLPAEAASEASVRRRLEHFEPQRIIAVRRAKVLAGAASLALLAASMWWLL